MSELIVPLNNKNGNCSQLKKLSLFDPFLDSSQMIRVGGRLGRADLSFESKHLKLIPQGTVGDVFIGFIHSAVAKHQGRIVSMAILIKEGYYLVNGKRRVSKIIYSCFTCKKLRGKPMVQKWLICLPSD